MSTHRSAFSLVELLVVIAIMSGLMALLLPAVQKARETGRRAACQNNLRQICTAAGSHNSSFKRYPFGGWGHEWSGMPGRGSGAKQPGSWAYSLLPFLEERMLHDLGAHSTGIDRVADYSTRLATPLAVFNCATRRACAPQLVAESYSYAGTPRPAGKSLVLARSDYAINGGVSHVFPFAGPLTLEEGDSPSYWKNVSSSTGFHGVSHMHTAAPISGFADGFGKTYFVGEKMVEPANYESGLSRGDKESLYTGFSLDSVRFAGLIPGNAPWLAPIGDTDMVLNPPGYLRFGSAHEAGLNMAYCDGSVRYVTFDVDEEVHFRAGHRRDEGAAVATLK